MDKRIDCPLCGDDVFPEHAKGTATNDETRYNFIVCVKCDGATHTPEPDNTDKNKNDDGLLPCLYQ